MYHMLTNGWVDVTVGKEVPFEIVTAGVGRRRVASCCVVDVTVGKEVPFEIVTAGAGKGQAKVTVSSPSGKQVPALTTAKADGFNSKFIPVEKGAHSVQVTFADQPVPRSPFTVTATEVSLLLSYLLTGRLQLLTYC